MPSSRKRNKVTPSDLVSGDLPLTTFPYRDIRRVRKLTKAAKQFVWPDRITDSFFVCGKRKELMLCMPGGFQVFYDEYIVSPGNGIHFVRISDRVLLQLPERFEQKKHYSKTLESMGFVVAALPEYYGILVSDYSLLRSQTIWCKEVQRIGSVFSFDNFSGLNTALARLLSYHAERAEWTNAPNLSVLKMIAADLREASSWSEFVQIIAPHAAKHKVDFDMVTKLGRLASNLHKPSLYLGADVDPLEEKRIVDSLWRSRTGLERSATDQPGTVRRGC
jgi:hypothetical protein